MQSSSALLPCCCFQARRAAAICQKKGLLYRPRLRAVAVLTLSIKNKKKFLMCSLSPPVNTPVLVPLMQNYVFPGQNRTFKVQQGCLFTHTTIYSFVGP